MQERGSKGGRGGGRGRFEKEARSDSMARLQDKAGDRHREIQKRGSEWGSSGGLEDDGTAAAGGGGGGGGGHERRNDIATPPARPSSRSSRRTSRPRNSALASSMAGTAGDHSGGDNSDDLNLPDAMPHAHHSPDNRRPTGQGRSLAHLSSQPEPFLSLTKPSVSRRKCLR